MTVFHKTALILAMAILPIHWSYGETQTDICKIKPVDYEWEHRYLTVLWGDKIPRSQQITFPDGQTISVIGHNHGSRKRWRELLDILKSSKWLGPEEFGNKLDGFINKDPQSRDHQEDDLQFLDQFLANRNGKPLNVWGESKSDFYPIWVKDTQSALSYIDTIVGNLKNPSHEQIESLKKKLKRAILVETGSAAVFYNATSPNPNKIDVQFGGLIEENPIRNIYMSSAALFDKFAKSDLWKITLSVEDFTRYTKKAHQIFLKILANDPRKILVMNDKDVEILLDNNFKNSPQYNKPNRQWLISLSKVQLRRDKAHVTRDLNDAAKMVESPGDDLFFVGAHHLSMMHLLKEACLERKSE